MGHKRTAAIAVGMLVATVVIAVASAAVPADGRVVLEPTGGQPRAGQDFVVVANVSSAGASNPFSFTLRLTFATGLELVSWRNPFQPIACERSGQTLTCRDRVIGGDIATNINLTLRAAASGRYEVAAALTVEDANDPNPANNTAQHFSEVLPAATTGPRVGTAGPDNLRGTSRADWISGRGGNDVLRGLGGSDFLDGGAGNDRLYGDGGNDRLVGGPGNDLLVGGPGANRYSAGADNDTVRARNGRTETVNCGAGRDAAVLDRSDRQTGCERITRR